MNSETIVLCVVLCVVMTLLSAATAIRGVRKVEDEVW